MFSPEVRLGSYELIAPLGVGGMGEVWKARDTRLAREVALKILPEDLARDPDRLSRFEREARLLAALNHPGIASIHGLEQVDGTPLLVLELVEGETLAERLVRGALPVPEALSIGIGIVEALEAAHAKGIVHRDLKPSNIMMTADERVKLLDFGLAKALENHPAASDVSQLSTDTSPTAVGVILGTAPYMSPEQARGQPVDERADIWAFGCVLYEMVTGRRAFPGATASDVIAAVLEREPDWSALPGRTPEPACALMRHCLQKQPSRRLRAIADARLDLEEALGSPGPLRYAPKRWLAAAAILGVIAVGVTYEIWRPDPQLRSRYARFNIDVASSTRLTPQTDVGILIAISPDGNRLVYQSAGQGGLYSRPLDSPQARLVPGTEGGSWPFFSPDGEWLGYEADGRLQKVSLAGGSPRGLADAPEPRGASWGPDGTIVYTPRPQSGLFRVSADGGPAVPLTQTDPSTETSHRWPQFLPGGRLVLFTIHPLSGRTDESAIAVLSLDTGQKKVVLKGGTYGRYVPTGHLVFANNGTVFAAPFDLSRLEVTGSARPVIENVRMGQNSTGVAQFDFSLAGSAVYVSPHARPRPTTLLWIDRTGKAQPVTPAASVPAEVTNIRLSPAGGHLAVETFEPDSANVWVLDIARQAWTRLTFDKDNNAPVWSRDGRQLAFSSNRAGSWNVFVMPAAGGAATRLTHSAHWQWPYDWSMDGRRVIFTDQSPEGHYDAWDVAADGQGTAEPLLAPIHRWGASDARVSPDGRWLAYVSFDVSRGEVYVRPYGAGASYWKVSTEGGCCPCWSRSGRELFFAVGLGKMMSAAVTTSPTFHAAPSRTVFERSREWNSYDVTADGRFIISEYLEAEPEKLQIVDIPDWFSELKAKVGMPR